MYKIFLDSDVVVSSLLSNLSASYQLINNKNVICHISNVSYEEIVLVIKKLNLDKKQLENIIKNKLKIINLKESFKQTKLNYKEFVKDLNDAHIVAGAVESKAFFLISYNIKDFQIEKIKKKLNIKIIAPGLFLQFLRSK